MFRKYFSLTLFATALVLASVGAATAQTGQLRGHVKLKQADGTVIPAVGAVVDVVRVDLSGKYEGKTDKRGEFVWAGLPFVGDYIIGVSMPNAQPSYLGNVKAGRDVDYAIELSPGDGHRLTTDELKKLVKVSPASDAAPAAKSSGGESAADKAKREELIKKNAEIMEKNKKVEEANTILNRTFKDGQAAVAAKNYDEAIKQFDEGIAADPEQTVLYTVKSNAIRMRGVERYNAAIKSADTAAKTSGLELAKGDFKLSAEIAATAIDVAKKEQPATDAAAQNSQNGRKHDALSSRIEAMRLYVSKADQSQTDAGIAAYEEYLAAEPDPVKKAKAQRDEALMLFDANAFDKALAVYQKILEGNPDDLDALLKSGLALFNIGAINSDKTKYQEAANYLQRFIDKAPETEAQNKSDAKDIIDNLKNNENVKPEKVTAPPKRRRP